MRKKKFSPGPHMAGHAVGCSPEIRIYLFKENDSQDLKEINCMVKARLLKKKTLLLIN
jgi:hypothetical protein